MYLSDINKIEMILKENKVKNQKALTSFRDTMRQKYCESGDCWFESKMNESECSTYEKLQADADDAIEVYAAFTNNDWR